MRQFIALSALMLGMVLAIASQPAQANSLAKDQPIRSYHIPTYKGKQHAATKSGLLSSQPSPPRSSILSNKMNWGPINPQPLPPKIGATVIQ